MDTWIFCNYFLKSFFNSFLLDYLVSTPKGTPAKKLTAVNNGVKVTLVAGGGKSSPSSTSHRPRSTPSTAQARSLRSVASEDTAPVFGRPDDVLDNDITIDGVGSMASFDYPYAMTTDHSGYIYICDYSDNVVRMIDPDTKEVTTIAGATSLDSDFADGRGHAARFNTIWGIVMDSNGDLLLAESANNALRKISLANLAKS